MGHKSSMFFSIFLTGWMAVAGCNTEENQDKKQDTGKSTGDGGVSTDGDGGADVSSNTPGYFHTSGSKILNDANQVVRLTGISWYGFELPSYALNGLEHRSMNDLLDVVNELGYNMLRVPYSNEFLEGHPPTEINYELNPELEGLVGLELLDALIAGAKTRGLRVILDRHRPTSEEQSPLWYSDTVPEERWISDWVMLAERYKDDTTVIGADLHNEPHGDATWGSGDLETDWRLAAQRAGDAVLEVAPYWLIVVEGIERVDGINYWWGGNLRAAGAFPVELSVPGQLVYSTHDYDNSLYSQSWFSHADYPENLPELWTETWGYLVEQDIAPVWVGEFGTRYEEEIDKIWFNTLINYMVERSISFAHWCVNADSSATGGLFFEDWTTLRSEKQSVVSPALAPKL